MAGAVTHTWPEDVRRVLVTTVLDGDHHDQPHNVAQALKAAKAGRLRLPEQPAWPSYTTVCEWVRKERNKRARVGHVEPHETPIDVAERLRLRALKIADQELAAIERRAENQRSPRRDMDRLEKVLAVVNRASPPTQRKPPAEKGAAQNGNRAKADGDGTTASDLATRLAARASKPTKAQHTTQRETETAQTQDNEDHNAQGSGSDSVSRTHAEPEPVLA